MAGWAEVLIRRRVLNSHSFAAQIFLNACLSRIDVSRCIELHLMPRNRSVVRLQHQCHSSGGIVSEDCSLITSCFVQN